MKKLVKIVALFIIIFLISSCGKKSYVVFNYNCNGNDYHKCELKDNKINCIVNVPECGDNVFRGWFKANEYNEQVDLNKEEFKDNEILYARWYTKEEYKNILDAELDN